MTTFLTPHFTLEELTHSNEAVKYKLDNTPTSEVIDNLKLLCIKILEPLRAKVGVINISSGYRSLAVNARVGGSQIPISAHTRGQAVDFSVPGYTAQRLFDFIKKTTLPYDKIILEFQLWVHIQYRKEVQPPRLEKYIATRNSAGQAVYTPA